MLTQKLYYTRVIEVDERLAVFHSVYILLLHLFKYRR